EMGWSRAGHGLRAPSTPRTKSPPRQGARADGFAVLVDAQVCAPESARRRDRREGTRWKQPALDRISPPGCFHRAAVFPPFLGGLAPLGARFGRKQRCGTVSVRRKQGGMFYLARVSSRSRAPSIFLSTRTPGASIGS